MECVRVAEGAFACLVPDRGWGWSNCGLVAAGDGLMVDTLMDVAKTRKALALFAEKVARPPERLVNTHHNIDHCWGNQLFRDKEILAHRECAERMAADLSPAALQGMMASPDLPPGARWFVEDVAEFDFSEVEPTPPNHLLDGDAELDLGGTRALLRYVGPAHTAGDLIVHLPEEGVLYAGDVIFRQCTPIGWEGTFAGWISALETIAALEPAVIVPGHGPLCGVEGATELADYLRYVWAESQRFYEQGLEPLEAARRIELGPYAAWNQPERLVFNVARAYRELRGGEWDEPVDFLPLLDAACALRESWKG